MLKHALAIMDSTRHYCVANHSFPFPSLNTHSIPPLSLSLSHTHTHTHTYTHTMTHLYICIVMLSLLLTKLYTSLPFTIHLSLFSFSLSHSLFLPLYLFSLYLFSLYFSYLYFLNTQPVILLV